MYNMIICLFLMAWSSCFAATTDIPEATRRSYAIKFHEAFIFQSAGLSTQAFFHFKDAYQEALKAGESPQKVAAIEELFRWYRGYGSSLHLFGREPTGNDRIVEPPRFYKSHGLQSPLAAIPSYNSEWGKTPEQAGQVREFMFGVGQVISGVFCITVGGPVVSRVGWTLCVTGIGTMYRSMNQSWVDHQSALIELQTWEANVKKAAGEE